MQEMLQCTRSSKVCYIIFDTFLPFIFYRPKLYMDNKVNQVASVNVKSQ